MKNVMNILTILSKCQLEILLMVLSLLIVAIVSGWFSYVLLIGSILYFNYRSSVVTHTKFSGGYNE